MIRADGPSNAERRATIEIPREPDLFGVVRSFVGATCRAWGMSEEVSTDAQVAISEALAFTDDDRVSLALWPGGSGDLVVRQDGGKEPAATAGSMGERLLSALATDLQWSPDDVLTFRIVGS